MHYAVPLIILCLTVCLFFIPQLISKDGGYREFGWPQTCLRILAALPLLLSGVVLHFLRPADTASIIPPGFPHPNLLVVISGVLEIAGGIGLFLPTLRKLSGFLIAVMMIAIFPANIYAAGKVVGGMQMPGVAVRTTMQAIYILIVLISAYGLPVASTTDSRRT